MSTLINAQSLQELKGIYRRLAAIHHPDRGGCERTMQRLNELYQVMQTRLRMAANDPRRNQTKSQAAMAVTVTDFSQVQVGERLYVNSTLCEVVGVMTDSFRVRALGRTRQSVFDKKTGIGLYNRRLRASYQRISRPHGSYH